MKIRIGDELLTEYIRVRIRLDFRGEKRNGQFFFGGKTKEQVAELIRDRQVAMLRNVPLQGVVLEEVDLSLEVYTVDELTGRRLRDVAYAPVSLTLRLENIEDVLPLLLKPEFRKIEVLSPESITVCRIDLERTLFRLNQAFSEERKLMEQKFCT
ncbi:MAG: hypothetical protein PHZ11_04625 [Desulfitobacteriaceae bacterium]|nr:hypothetical protein [Desulfitobacteriaceae bacterium]MDD4346172.1 hypothetical protein [Desulfitobacteriaceae bacterium]MDD4400875.1 hypothetical protein [Desulfitobacteriaceae bacterium]